jgi:predicted dienelactone hydrolase
MKTSSSGLSRRLVAGLFSALLGACAGSASAQVGMQPMQVGAMTVTLVYPTTALASRQTLGPFRIDVALGAPALEKRQRLIVISHGSGGSPLANHALAAAFAQAGFVVAQPLHEGNNFQDQRLAGPETFIKRPGEVTQVIDALAKEPRWAVRLALDKVGVHGMSAGGVTGLSLAGAQWRRLDLIRHCQNQAQDDEGFCFAGAASGPARTERQAAFDNVGTAPDA